MTLLRIIIVCLRAAAWWLVCQKWVGGGPGHPSYTSALFELSVNRLLVRLWAKGKL